MGIEHHPWCSYGEKVSSFPLTTISEKEEKLENVEIAFKRIVRLCLATMLIHKFFVELLVQKTLERRLFEMEEENIKEHSHPTIDSVTGSDFIPSMVSQKSRVCKQIEDRLACEGSPGSFHKDFHLIDLDADITSRVEVNPSSNLPLRGFDPAQSSNGLLLLEYTNIDTDVQKCIVFNPVTCEYVRLLETVYPCINPETNQFKDFLVFHRSSPSDATSDSLMELDLSSDSALNSHSETVVDLVSDPVSKLPKDVLLACTYDLSSYF